MGPRTVLRLNQALFLLAASMLATAAHASYGQMRLDGLGLLLALLLLIAYALIVDVALIARLFRFRAVLVVGVIVALVVAFLLLSQAVSPVERAGFIRSGSSRVMLVVTSAVLLPFILVAPFGQYRAVREGQRWPRWVAAWMALQVGLIPGFIILAGTDRYFRQQEYTAAYAEGRQVQDGELAALLELADQRHERIWGTPWKYPWRQAAPSAWRDEPSGWIYGLAMGLDASALIARNEPLGAPDREALRTLQDRHFVRFAVPNVRAKVLWDTIEPGNFAATLGPEGMYQEVVPILLERLEKDGEVRFCPGGRMVHADRAALNSVIVANGGGDHLRPPWDSYQRRVERLCTGREQP